MRKSALLFFLLVCVGVNQVSAQEYSKFDFGRMWTFEDAPLAYFNETYDLDLDQAWMDNVRKSALRFSTFCWASFVSEQGFIMCNHLCARGFSANIQREGEHLIKYGFSAKTREDERNSEGWFVEQLIRAKDVTEQPKRLQESLPEEEARD